MKRRMEFGRRRAARNAQGTKTEQLRDRNLSPQPRVRQDPVSRSLRGTVRRARRQGAVFTEAAFGSERSVDLVSGDLHEALDPGITSRLQEDDSTEDICLGKTLRAQDRTVYMTLCGKVNDMRDTTGTQQLPDRILVTDTPLDKFQAGIVEVTLQVVEITRVGEKIIDKHPGLRLFIENQANKVTTDKTRSPGNQDRIHLCCSEKNWLTLTLSTRYGF